MNNSSQFVSKRQRDARRRFFKSDNGMRAKHEKPNVNKNEILMKSSVIDNALNLLKYIININKAMPIEIVSPTLFLAYLNRLKIDVILLGDLVNPNFRNADVSLECLRGVYDRMATEFNSDVLRYDNIVDLETRLTTHYNKYKRYLKTFTDAIFSDGQGKLSIFTDNQNVKAKKLYATTTIRNMQMLITMGNAYMIPKNINDDLLASVFEPFEILGDVNYPMPLIGLGLLEFSSVRYDVCDVEWFSVLQACINIKQIKVKSPKMKVFTVNGFLTTILKDQPSKKMRTKVNIRVSDSFVNNVKLPVKVVIKGKELWLGGKRLEIDETKVFDYRMKLSILLNKYTPDKNVTEVSDTTILELTSYDVSSDLYLHALNEALVNLDVTVINKILVVGLKAIGKTNFASVLQSFSVEYFLEDSDDYGKWVLWYMTKNGYTLDDLDAKSDDAMESVAEFYDNYDVLKNSVSFYNGFVEDLISHYLKQNKIFDVISVVNDPLLFNKLIDYIRPKLEQVMLKFNASKRVSQTIFEDGIYAYLMKRKVLDGGRFFYIFMPHLVSDNSKRRPADISGRISVYFNSSVALLHRSITKNSTTVEFLADLVLQNYYIDTTEFTVPVFTYNQFLSIMDKTAILTDPVTIEIIQDVR